MVVYWSEEAKHKLKGNRRNRDNAKGENGSKSLTQQQKCKVVHRSEATAQKPLRFELELSKNREIACEMDQIAEYMNDQGKQMRAVNGR